MLERQEAIENSLAARHLTNGTLVLYDVSSAAFEGHTCPLGKIGHASDGVKGWLQIVYGLLCSPAGVPIAIEVFDGNTADPKTLAAQITSSRPVRADDIALVGDRGMLKRAPPDELRPAQLDRISALRARRSRHRSATGRCSCRCTTSRTSTTSPPRLRAREAGELPQRRPGPAARLRTRRAAGGHRRRETIATGTSRQKRRLRGRDKIAGGWARRETSSRWRSISADHRRGVQFLPQAGRDRRRGRPRRHLRAAHQPARRDTSATRSCCATRTSPTSNGSSARKSCGGRPGRRRRGSPAAGWPARADSACGRSGR